MKLPLRVRLGGRRPWAVVQGGRSRICLGQTFWRAAGRVDAEGMATTLLHECLHIFFDTIRHRLEKWAYNTPTCYERYVLLCSGIPIPPDVNVPCPSKFPARQSRRAGKRPCRPGIGDWPSPETPRTRGEASRPSRRPCRSIRPTATSKEAPPGGSSTSRSSRCRCRPLCAGNAPFRCSPDSSRHAEDASRHAVGETSCTAEEREASAARANGEGGVRAPCVRREMRHRGSLLERRRLRRCQKARFTF